MSVLFPTFGIPTIIMRISRFNLRSRYYIPRLTVKSLSTPLLLMAFMGYTGVLDCSKCLIHVVFALSSLKSDLLNAIILSCFVKVSQFEDFGRMWNACI